MFQIVFKESAARVLDRFSSHIRARILKKLHFYSLQRNPLNFAEHLKENAIGEWRFRIGDYRVLFDVSQGKIIVLKVGHRKDIYK